MKLTETSQGSRGSVVLYPGRTRVAEHERVTYLELGRRLARLQGLEFLGEFDSSAEYRGRLYFLPVDTLIGLEHVHQLGIESERDLFGGVVPQPFIATKAITHPLVRPDARSIQGWSAEFCKQVSEAVLVGNTVFSLEDALHGGRKLLERGPVRIKLVRANAGRGQSVIADPGELARVLDTLDEMEVTNHGLVLEEQLEEVITHSIGQVRVDGRVATYYGTQHLTHDNAGDAVYGGTELVVVRGDFSALLALDLPEEIQLAAVQAQVYDTAATECFPGFIASRRNYDVAWGIDAEGRRRSGVLEQSWRVGGASSAEIVALEAFQEEPVLQVVRASSLEIYGEQQSPPPRATILFSGEDPEAGSITKCVLVEPYDH